MPKSAAQLLSEYKRIYAAADEEGRDLTSSERDEVASLVEAAQQQKGIEVAVRELDPGAPGPAFTDPHSNSPGGGPGDRFIQSKGWKSIADPSLRGQQWSTGAVQVSDKHLTEYQLKAGTLLESGQGAGLVPVPQVVPGIVSKLFEPLSVVNLLGSAQATTSSVRYMLEGTATSGAAGVAEGGTKPASDLAYSTVDEPVKKVATILTVSDELLDDAAQIQAYLNSRLTLFVRIEEERQLLRGAGTNELVGLFGRAINTYAAGADTGALGAKAIYKAAVGTRGSSNLPVTGIVLHPTNYASIRMGTTTTGEFTGGGPFSNAPQAGPYQDSLWGIPVALSTVVGLGTALIGAFGQAASVYRRGGVSVEATNSHASYFTSDLVAIRAEQRQALAVFRPGAFTQVTGLGTAI